MADMKIGFYGHVKQYHNLKPEIDRAIHEVLESGSYVLGPQLVKFEQELAQYMNAKETVGLNSGTDALLLTFLALGIGPGDEVITTSNTFFATAEAIWLAGATPVLVDIDPRTRNIDPPRIEGAITPRTRALVPVHLYGLPADMAAVSRIARAHNLLVVEDCAQAIGARGDSFSIGELSDAVCLSFIIQKNLGCFGDGGAIATNNADLATAVRKLRNHGSLKRSHHSIGYNSRLDDLHAAVLRIKLKRVDEWTRLRQGLASEYDRLLADLPLTLPYTPPGYRHVYHLYVVRLRHSDRDGHRGQSEQVDRNHHPHRLDDARHAVRRDVGTYRKRRLGADRGQDQRMRDLELGPGPGNRLTGHPTLDEGPGIGFGDHVEHDAHEPVGVF